MLRRTVRPHKLKPTLTTIFEQNNIYIYTIIILIVIYIIYIFSGLYLRELKLHRPPLPLDTVTIGFNLYPCASSNDLRASVPYSPCMHRVQTWANGRGSFVFLVERLKAHAACQPVSGIISVQWKLKALQPGHLVFVFGNLLGVRNFEKETTWIAPR